MVAWEIQLAERSVPAWRDKYVMYGRLKRKLDQVERIQKKSDKDALRFMENAVTTPRGELEAGLMATVQQHIKEFMDEVHGELRRVSAWYEAEATALEARVRQATSRLHNVAGAAGLLPGGDHGVEELERLHLESAQLTEYVLLNVEALRKIVKKMDKTCGTKEQKGFVEDVLKQSTFATLGGGQDKAPFGERARRCRQQIEEQLSPERIKELRSRAMSEGVGRGPLSVKSFKSGRVAFAAALAAVLAYLSGGALQGRERAQRCVALVVFTVAMWIGEAAPFEATALFVPPLAVILNVLQGSRQHQAKLLIASVFTDSLYLVLGGFCISSVFTRCQLESRVAAWLQQAFGSRPFAFMLAIMFLGVGLSALLSNVTAPLLLIEVLKPLVKDAPTDSRYSRALLLGLAFSCNIGGMMTPISSPQNVAALSILRQHGGSITWVQWLSVSIPFCSAAVFVGWLLLLAVYKFDMTQDELDRNTASDCNKIVIPVVIFEEEELTTAKLMGLVLACATLAAFACAPIADLFGGTSMVAVLFVSVALGTGTIQRQTFNSYSWHLLFLIGGGSALGFAVNESGLLEVLTEAAKKGLSADPMTLVAELVLVLVAATTFVSHTVAALVLMPLVVQLGASAGVRELAVFVCGLACSVACALPMTSFPNVNSLMAVDDLGIPWLSMRHFLIAGTPMTLVMTMLLLTLGLWLASVSL